MSRERDCVRGCVTFEVGEDGKRQPLHYAACTNPETCGGCVPRECREGSLICDQCFGKARALLSDAPDLLGRLRSEADAGKSGWNWDSGPVVRSTAVHANGPIGDDLLDAITAVEYGMWFYAAGIETLANNAAAMSQLGPLLLDIHKPDEDGVREAWSMLDALKRWGLERRGTHRHVFPGKLPNAPLGSYAKFDEEEQGEPVGEWFDPILSVAQVAERTKVGERDIRRWITKGLITPVARIREGSAVRTYLRASEADRVAADWIRQKVE
ncbi:helix-turn-helix domain-containing protein [Microbacterium sp. NPDC089190]|uniref:helix-turn-helix domain-containing protein n=1 Tax=Microbacterium sp. NPDC089190 TaxID=3155063 RepID=UPI00344BD8DE